MNEFRNVSNNFDKIAAQQENIGLKIFKIEEDSKKTRDNMDMVQKQVKDLKEFDIKTLQTQIQFDLKDLGHEVKSLGERLQTAPDKVGVRKPAYNQ